MLSCMPNDKNQHEKLENFVAWNAQENPGRSDAASIYLAATRSVVPPALASSYGWRIMSKKVSIIRTCHQARCCKLQPTLTSNNAAS